MEFMELIEFAECTGASPLVYGDPLLFIPFPSGILVMGRGISERGAAPLSNTLPSVRRLPPPFLY